VRPWRIFQLWWRSRVLRDRTAKWNYEYATGRWDDLSDEHGRLAATADLLHRHAPRGRILEVGCGAAMLQPFVDFQVIDSWLGVDLSSVAIARAQTSAGPRVRYAQADMMTFTPEGVFDAIVFTESIYYVGDCAGVLRRYTPYLKPRGVFIVSIYRSKESEQVWQQIHGVAVKIDAATTTGRGTWDCEVLSPLRREGPQP
jgi:trans-aconitate methyltransferase